MAPYQNISKLSITHAFWCEGCFLCHQLNLTGQDLSPFGSNWTWGIPVIPVPVLGILSSRNETCSFHWIHLGLHRCWRRWGFGRRRRRPRPGRVFGHWVVENRPWPSCHRLETVGHEDGPSVCLYFSCINNHQYTECTLMLSFSTFKKCVPAISSYTQRQLGPVNVC